jgi:hypothetical protein
MSHEQYRYEHDPIVGDYVLKHGNRVLFRATSLAVCYSEDTEILGDPGEPAYTLLKHGNSDQVLEHAHKIRTAYRQAGFPNMASEVVVVLSDLWDVETLNKIISTSGYLDRFIREQSNSSESQTQPQYQAEDKSAPQVVRNSICQLSKNADNDGT